MRIKNGVGTLVLVMTALITVLASTGVRAHKQGYVFSSFDFPGAAVTQAYGINARGDIVGTFQNAPPNNQNHGFILRDGEFIAIDFPGGDTDHTIATAIGPSGDVVGYYGLIGGPPTSAHGFLRDRQGNWSTVQNPPELDPPPTMTPGPLRILPDGTMVGCFHYATPLGVYISMHGFTLAPDGTFSRFDYPGAMSWAMHYGATPDGRMVVGVFTSAGINHGYIVSDGVVTTFDVPGSGRATPQDINPDGVVVGMYRNPGEPSKVHGFVIDTHRSTDQANWEHTQPVDVPGASITRIRGINARGDLVGDYVAADGKNHGFVSRDTGPEK
jgi:hypothetical protein